jgi:hypothetical protein
MANEIVIFKHGDEQIEALPIVIVDEFGNISRKNIAIDGVKRQEAVAMYDVAGASAKTYTRSIDCSNHKEVSGLVKSDVAGTLKLEQSMDAYDWLATDTITLTANTTEKFAYKIYSKYIRFVYENGATAQTEFALSGFLNN